MVDFALSDEQRALQELAHDFAEREIRPVAWELDRDGTFPLDLIARAHGVGLMNLHIPEEFGGAGLGHLDAALIEEELAWGCSGVQTSLGANALAMTPLLLAGSESLRRRYLERFAASPVLASFCLTEPAAGSDVAAISTRAVRRGSAYVISGSKCFITNGGYADVYVVFAKTDPGAGHRGISCFVVPRDAGVVVDASSSMRCSRRTSTRSAASAAVQTSVTRAAPQRRTSPSSA